jgi:hypothetical protein
MRKLMLVGALAALATVLIATPASASFDSHFTVRGVGFKLHRISDNRFTVRFKLRHRGARVGTAHGRCHVRSKHKTECRNDYHLNGKVGGRGDIHALGANAHDRARSRFDVTGGTGDFNGVAGKVIESHQNKNRFHLVA